MKPYRRFYEAELLLFKSRLPLGSLGRLYYNGSREVTHSFSLSPLRGNLPHPANPFPSNHNQEIPPSDSRFEDPHQAVDQGDEGESRTEGYGHNKDHEDDYRGAWEVEVPHQKPRGKVSQDTSPKDLMAKNPDLMKFQAQSRSTGEDNEQETHSLSIAHPRWHAQHEEAGRYSYGKGYQIGGQA